MFIPKGKPVFRNTYPNNKIALNSAEEIKKRWKGGEFIPMWLSDIAILSAFLAFYRASGGD